MEVICFHLITEPNAYLSNWYPSTFDDDGIRYCCSEQHIMRQKAVMFGDEDSAARVMATEDPQEMQDIGRQVSGFDKDVWLGSCQLVAWRALRAKFSANALLRERLLSTGDAVLAECARSDYLWGIGRRMTDPLRLCPKDWRGKSVLGNTLMLVREQLRSECGDAERKTPLLHAFAKRLAHAAKTIGEAGIVAAVSPEEMWSLGLEMDCGKSFERMYKQELGDLQSLELDSDRIDDPLILGSAIFSEWRYYTHWANCGMDEEAVRWFEVAARRLEEITVDRTP